jgi:hypothetical protein
MKFGKPGALHGSTRSSMTMSQPMLMTQSLLLQLIRLLANKRGETLLTCVCTGFVARDNCFCLGIRSTTDYGLSTSKRSVHTKISIGI